MEISDRLAYYQALELAQFKGGFLARTAHELRSPLSSLMGLHQLILTDLCDSPEEERECVAKAYEAAQNFLGLLESVIEVSKFDHGSRTLKIQPCSLSGLLQEVQLAVSLPLSDRNISLTIADIPDELTVEADYDCLRQVLIQLILLAADQKASNIALEIISSESSTLGLRFTDDRLETAQQEMLDGWEKMQRETTSPLSPPQDLHRQWSPKHFSSGFSMFMQQSLLEMMGGQLEIAAQVKVAAQATQPTSESGEITDPRGTAEEPEFILHCWLPTSSSPKP